MKSLALTILAIYSAFLAGFGAFYIYNKYYVSPAPSCLNNCSNTTNSPNKKQLDLTDFDILLVTNETSKKMFHINYVDYPGAEYQLANLDYSLDGSTLKSQSIPIKDIYWEQVSINNSNSEYKIIGSFVINGQTYKFNVPSVKLGMVVRAEPTTGKYAGTTNGSLATIVTNGNTLNAYAGITAGFFTNYPKESLSDLQVNTHWFMYFDKDWNFYHLDKTNVANPSATYYSHEFFSKINSNSTQVTYYKLNGEPSNDTKSLNVSAKLGLESLDNTYNLQSPFVPYTYAKTYLMSQDTGGIGIYTNINSVTE